MAQITAKLVSDLRAKTGCGMMECKKALVEADGDFDAAIKVLRERGLNVAAKKQDRIAADGIVDIEFNAAGDTAAMIEVNTESDFVAKNESFKAFVKGILKVILEKKPADVDALLAEAYDESGSTVEATLKEQIFKIGEKITIRRFVIVEGTLTSYIHGHGATGVLVAFNADDAAKQNPEFAGMIKNVALQVAAMNCTYVNREAVPASVLEEEKEVLIKTIQNDPKNANKPANILEKMVVGKLGKFYETYCLSDQLYVKDDSITVAKYLENCSKELGGNVTLKDFYRYEKGEGIQKREDDLAAEVAKMIK
ncbi:MAG: elongation factor Ts [Ruminococcaceae bacterium]|nr:elongation factor Ts [Oscillospiraceae bacterium]